MIQSGLSFRPFAEINRDVIPSLVQSHFWSLLIAQNVEECVLTTLMELRTAEWRELLVRVPNQMLDSPVHLLPYRHGPNATRRVISFTARVSASPSSRRSHTGSTFFTERFAASLYSSAFPTETTPQAVVAFPWLRDFEDEWPLTIAWRRLDPTYPATLIRLK